MNPATTVKRILKSVGAKLERTKKHQIWKLPDGRTFVRASTPSCSASDANNLSDLRKLIPEARHPYPVKNPDRKPKIPHGGDGKRFFVPPSGPSPMHAALLASGAVESALRGRIACLENELAQANESRDRIKVRMETERMWCWRCPVCRFRKWLEVRRHIDSSIKAVPPCT